MTLGIKSLIATVVLTLGVLPALAEPDFSASSQNISPEVCQNTSSRHYIIECLYKEAKESDRRLNEAYQQVSSSLNAKERSELIKVQNTWIKYRDETCEPFRNHFKYGRESVIQYWGCIERLTKQRTAELEND